MVCEEAWNKLKDYNRIQGVAPTILKRVNTLQIPDCIVFCLLTGIPWKQNHKYVSSDIPLILSAETCVRGDGLDRKKIG